MKTFDYAIASTAAGALKAMGEGYRVKAGGIDLLDLMKEGIEQGERFVSIQNLDALRGIAQSADGGLVIGALTTLEDIATSAPLATAFPALMQAVRHAATPQIRQVATVGGNLLQKNRCWYFRNKDIPCLKKGGSTCFAVEGENRYHALFGKSPCHAVHPSNVAPALVAAGGEVVALSPAGERVIPAAEFFLPPEQALYRETTLRENELLVSMRFRTLPTASAYVDVKEKQSFDWPLASALVARMPTDGWRVVLGHVAGVPWRARAAEKLLANTADITPDLAAQAAEAAVADATPMRDNAWRARLARACVRRALLQAVGKDPMQ